jgi:hypothetical protein
LKDSLAVVVAALGHADRVAANLVDPRNSLNGKVKESAGKQK